MTASLLQPQSVAAIRLEGSAPRVDGRLTETVWRSAPAITNLTQREPNEGSPAIENTEVRSAYDDDALYVGARMFSNDPRAIRALVTRRDREGSSEQLVVSLDTYRDRRTAYTFSVTPAGVRIDYYHSSDSEGDRDSDWNPVWEAATDIDSLGWTAEFRVPFAQLRFSPGDVQEWGVNVVRLTLETYMEPFAASGRFHSFGETLAPRRRELLVYGTNGTTIVRNVDGLHTVTDGAEAFDIDDEDFNERSFRTNVVLRWEWRLGSTLYLVWQQNRDAELPFAAVRPRHLFDALDTRGENFLAIKVSYWTSLR